MSPRTNLSARHGELPIMKKLTFALAAAAMTALASPAAAQPVQDETTISIIGSAEAFCKLPETWAYASSTGNVGSSQFSGNTWSIPPELIATTNGNAVVSTEEVAIRVRGMASCNTSHIITLTSSNGGLAHAASASSPPAGFTRSRRMIYNANWRDKSWGVFNWVPTAPGDSRSYDHGVTVPPGNHEFDIRMGLLRDPTNSPMLAGPYNDQLTITITVPS